MKRHDAPRPPRRPVKDPQSVVVYDDDVAEFLCAVLRFRTAHRRPPTLIEAFRLALTLGWRKDAPP